MCPTGSSVDCHFSCLSEELRDDERVVKAAVARFLGGQAEVYRLLI